MILLCIYLPSGTRGTEKVPLGMLPSTIIRGRGEVCGKLHFSLKLPIIIYIIHIHWLKQVIWPCLSSGRQKSIILLCSRKEENQNIFIISINTANTPIEHSRIQSNIILNTSEYMFNDVIFLNHINNIVHTVSVKQIRRNGYLSTLFVFELEGLKTFKTLDILPVAF